MKKSLTFFLLLPVSILLLDSCGSANQPTDSAAPPPAEEESIDYERQTEYDFEDDMVEGEMADPEGDYIEPVTISDEKSYFAGRASSTDDEDAGSDGIAENPFISSDLWNISSVYPSSNITSYNELIMSLEYEELPGRDLQINELINAYDLSGRIAETGGSVLIEVHPAPWKPEHHLLLISVVFSHDAENVVNPIIEVEFNATTVKEFRLLGHEELGQELGDLGDRLLPGGYSSQVLYELVLNNTGGPLGDLLISADDLDPVSVQIPGEGPDVVSSEFKLSAALAELGLIVRDSQYKGNASMERIVQNLDSSKELYPDAGYLHDLLKRSYLRDK